MAAAAFQTQLPHVALPSGHSPAISKAQRRNKRSSRNVCMLEKAFENWLAHGGARVSRIEPTNFPGGLRGIKATDTIRAGDVLIEVPEKLLISTCTARDSLHFGLHHRGTGPLTSLQTLAAFLVYELSKGAHSFWYAYLRSLPQSYTCLSYFSADEAAQLQVAHARAAADAARQEVKQSHAAIKPLLVALGLPEKYKSLAAIRWALATLNSRTMFLEGDNAGVLMPFGDLHNHSPPPGPQLPDLGLDAVALQGVEEHTVHGDGSFDQQACVYRLYARSGYEAGDQVFLCYGSHSNLDLLEHYGFVLDSNPHDAALLPIEALPDSQLRGGLQQKDCWLHPCGVPSWELLRALRIWAAMQSGHGRDKHAAIEGRRISKESEILAMGSLKAACSDLLRRFPTSIDRDKDILEGSYKSGKLSECEQLAVRWRCLYKQILRDAIEVAKIIADSCT